MKIYYHPQFGKSYKFLSKEIKEKAEAREKIFRNNAFHPSLKTHKLTGKLKNQWSFSVNNHLSVINFIREYSRI